MGKRVGIVVAVVLWFLFIFWVTFRLSFPSTAVAERIQYEVQEASRGEYTLEMRDVAPWWTGISAQSVVVYTQDRRSPSAEPQLAFAADAARVRVGLASLLRRTPRVVGAVTVGSGDVDFDVATVTNRQGDGLSLGQIRLDAPGLDVADLAMLAGVEMEATGQIEIEAEITAPEGMRSADGDASVTAHGVVIQSIDLSAMGVPNLGMEIPVDDLDIQLSIEDGKAEIRRGRVRSKLGTVEIDGSLSLREDLSRSSLDVVLLISELDALKAELGDLGNIVMSAIGTPWADGKIHYKCSGSLQRPRCFQDRERSRSSRSGTTRPPTRAPIGGEAAAGSASSGTASGTTGSASSGSSTTPSGDEDRERRKDEIRERLRQRREEARAAAEERELNEGADGSPFVDPEDEFLFEEDEEGDGDLEDLFDDEAIPFEEAFDD